MEKEKRRLETAESGNWWDEYSPETILRVLVAPVIEHRADVTGVDHIQVTKAAVRSLAEYLRESFPDSPVTPLESAGTVLSQLTPPQCDIVIAQPFVAGIANGGEEMEDIGTERPYR